MRSASWCDRGTDVTEVDLQLNYLKINQFDDITANVIKLIVFLHIKVDYLLNPPTGGAQHQPPVPTIQIHQITVPIIVNLT